MRFCYAPLRERVDVPRRSGRRLATSSPDLSAGYYENVRYVFQPTDTIGHVVRVLVAMKERFRTQVGSSRTRARLEIDWPPKPR